MIPAPAITLGNADSNSPAVWDLVNGRPYLFAFTSINGWSTRHAGPQLSSLLRLAGIEFIERPQHGVWFEAVVADADGSWYGYYHNEIPAHVCNDPRRMIPRIGAARSDDQGATWEDLGIILEAPKGWHDCASSNDYFVGGVGDFSVILDQDQRYIYFFVSQYGSRQETQGVAVARMPWAFRGRPKGHMSLWWRDTVWVPTRRLRSDDEEARYAYPAGAPIHRVSDGWHDGERVDAFWGPSVHWNTHLQQYVMLLNRASDSAWRQEGIYVSYNRSLESPNGWSMPRRLIAGGMWYPQVIGTEAGVGTDKLAGERARFFMSGRSQYLIQFTR